MPTVDVIVPCYNYGRFLRSCLDSVLGQAGCTVRVLIIDDASQDDSLQVALAIAARDPRVEVQSHSVNRGHIATYNEGIDWLRAEYMLLLSSDDVLAPGALAHAVAVMEANPRVGFVHGEAIRFSEDSEITSMRAEGMAVGGRTAVCIEAGPEFIRRICKNPVNPIETATVVVRTALQKQVGGYEPELPHAGDLEMWLRLAARSDVGVVPRTQAFTRIHARNMRHGYSAERMYADYRQRHRAFEIFFAGQSGLLDDAGDLAQLAQRALAQEVLWAAARGFEETRDPACGRLVQLAHVIDTTITRTPLWWKTVARQLLGPTGWQVIAPALQRVRSLPQRLGRRPRVGV